MAAQSNAAPVIIKRKKISNSAEHHGGAWKVAYADFVTAMMAFFLLMWLLNATTEKQRKGLADYFNPVVPVNRISGGGDGALGGDSIFSEMTMAQNGTGATTRHSTEAAQARGTAGSAEDSKTAFEELSREIQRQLTARGGESMTMARLMRHVVTKVTDQGLVIEVFDLPYSPLFEGDSAAPTQTTRQIAAMLAEVLRLARNPIAVDGYVRSYPITLIDNPVWRLSSARAQSMRELLQQGALPRARFARVTGHADRAPLTANPTVVRNNRIEVILLRDNR